MLSRLYVNADLAYLYTLEEEEYEFPAVAINWFVSEISCFPLPAVARFSRFPMKIKRPEKL